MDINNIYFYLLLGVFFYFLFTYILENYLVEQENFDPSLVPVSSIVTLAKVAQKLVNGNGTLTNPGNLQIGKDVGTPSGSLTVTGKTAIGSTTMGDKTLNVTGTLGVSGKTVINSAGIPSTLAPANYPDLAVGGSMGVTGNSSVMGDLDVTGTTTMNGTSSLKTNVWHTSTDGANRLHYTDKAGTYFGSGDGTYYWRSNTTGKMDASGQNGGIMELNRDGNLKVSGTAGVGGNLSVGGTISSTGNLNARTSEGFNTRVGGIWTSGGIYAEGTSNLEIGAGSTNVYIGAANGGATNNLKVTGISHDSADPIMLGNLKHNTQCLSGDGTNNSIVSKTCDRNDITQFWTYKGVRFTHISSGKCMTITENPEAYNQSGSGGTKFGLRPCDIKNGDQVLRWNQYTRRIHRWKNNFTNHSDHWVTQVRLQDDKTLHLWDDNCGHECVWDAF